MKSDSGRTDSLWTATADVPLEAPLTEDAVAAVCIVGAGISGLTTAYLLSCEGVSVVVLDDGPIAGGESGRTTAHLSNALDDRYYELERLHGERGARLAAESHTRAISEIERIVTDQKIDCEFSRLDGYLFLEKDGDPDQLQWELESAHRAGLSGVRLLERAPIPSFNSGTCLLFPGQAQFHPVKYLAGLAQKIRLNGGRIFTRSHVEKIQGGDEAHVVVNGGLTVSASAIVVATNTPVNDRVAMHTKQAPYRTYVIGAPIRAGSIPTALYWDTADPYHYVRLAPVSETQDMLIIGGEDHKTGQANDTDEPFRDSRTGRASYFRKSERWSTAGQGRSWNLSIAWRSSDAIPVIKTSI